MANTKYGSNRSRKWRRNGEPPVSLRVTVVFDQPEHAELIALLWDLPYGKSGPYVREVLVEHFRRLQDKSGEEPDPAQRLENAVQRVEASVPAVADSLLNRMEAAVRGLETVMANLPLAGAAPSPGAHSAGAEEKPESPQQLSENALRFARLF